MTKTLSTLTKKHRAAIARAEDRLSLAALVAELGLLQPRYAAASTVEEALAAAERIGYPVLLRTSTGTRGEGAALARTADAVAARFPTTQAASKNGLVRVDAFLEHASEVDVLLVADRTGEVRVAGIVEHVEEAGVHAADATCTLPPHSLTPEVTEKLKDASQAIARALPMVGVLGLRFAVQGKDVHVLSADARAPRFVELTEAATGFPLRHAGALCEGGDTLRALGHTRDPEVRGHWVREAVIPASADLQLGPAAKSTGEVVATGPDLSTAFARSQLAAGIAWPSSGKVWIDVAEGDEPHLVDFVRRLQRLGFTVLATEAARAYLATKHLEVAAAGDDARDAAMLFAHRPTRYAEALARGVPYFTTPQAMRMAVGALEALASRQRAA